MLLPALNAELTLDPKGRLMLPRQLQVALEMQGINGLVAFANGGPNKGLALYTHADWDALVAQHRGTPLDPRSRLFALAIQSTAQTVSVDNAGRMLIPQPLRRMLNLERELYLFTAGSWFEVWDRPRWEDQALPEAAALWDQLYGFDSLKPPAGPVPA
jgi:MraZ protein